MKVFVSSGSELEAIHVQKFARSLKQEGKQPQKLTKFYQFCVKWQPLGIRA